MILEQPYNTKALFITEVVGLSFKGLGSKENRSDPKPLNYARKLLKIG